MITFSNNGRLRRLVSYTASEEKFPSISKNHNTFPNETKRKIKATAANMVQKSLFLQLKREDEFKLICIQDKLVECTSASSRSPLFLESHPRMIFWMYKTPIGVDGSRTRAHSLEERKGQGRFSERQSRSRDTYWKRLNSSKPLLHKAIWHRLSPDCYFHFFIVNAPKCPPFF